MTGFAVVLFIYSICNILTTKSENYRNVCRYLGNMLRSHTYFSNKQQSYSQLRVLNLATCTSVQWLESEEERLSNILYLDCGTHFNR